ncbi:unnamed protein product [Vitrella brassicaformis CCMP3155]|uniref:RING-type domain-containing protein n=1 Tax=Vitrella brassicaformis (strain CCMP3155) TaxID=1169540 RepID=A0A0G4G1M5_VITBC|nr:unnamed protein product [Vitrella brassicaformis CCMP3155]|eukprot:CEM21947.1 unnamed protein product [Vitrella brassicaformis CCMP3155]
MADASAPPDEPLFPAHTNGGGDDRWVSKVHILPLRSDVNDIAEADASEREAVMSHLRANPHVRRWTKITTQCRRDFVVIEAEPDEGMVNSQTHVFTEGPPLIELERVQFAATTKDPDAEQVCSDEDLWLLYVKPFIESNPFLVAMPNRKYDCDGVNVVCSATRPNNRMGLVVKTTLVHANWDGAGEFNRVHFVPFSDTLPTARTYGFNLWDDYLRPYLQTNPLKRFRVGDIFTYQGVQFRLVIAEPDAFLRVGPETTVHCSGTLAPTIRNLLPREVLATISHLPPPLQLYVLNNTDLSQSDVERILTASGLAPGRRPRGMTEAQLNKLPLTQMKDTTRPAAAAGGDGGGGGYESLGARASPSRSASGSGSSIGSDTKCMICLGDLEPGDWLRKLPCCNQYFHRQCIDEWLQRSFECPLCKTDLRSAVGAAPPPRGRSGRTTRPPAPPSSSSNSSPSDGSTTNATQPTQQPPTRPWWRALFVGPGARQPSTRGAGAGVAGGGGGAAAAGGGEGAASSASESAGDWAVAGGGGDGDGDGPGPSSSLPQEVADWMDRPLLPREPDGSDG